MKQYVHDFSTDILPLRGKEKFEDDSYEEYTGEKHLMYNKCQGVVFLEN